MTDQIVDRRQVFLPGPVGDVTPQAMQAKLDAEAARDQARVMAAGTVAMQDEAVASLLADRSSKARRTLDRRVMVWFGDSWSDPASGDNSGHGAIPRNVAARLGCELYNYAVGGTGLVTGDMRFAYQVAQAVADTSYDNADVAWAVCFGGINDRHVIPDTGAINRLMESMADGFPNARCVVIPMQHAWNASDWGYTYDWIQNYRRNGTPQVAVIDDAAYWALGDKVSFYNSNPGHPNALGVNIMSTKIISALTGGSPKANATSLGFQAQNCQSSSLVVANGDQPGTIMVTGHVQPAQSGTVVVGHLSGQVLQPCRGGTLFVAPQTTTDNDAGNGQAPFMRFEEDPDAPLIADYIGHEYQAVLHSAVAGINYYFWQSMPL